MTAETVVVNTPSCPLRQRSLFRPSSRTERSEDPGPGRQGPVGSRGGHHLRPGSPAPGLTSLARGDAGGSNPIRTSRFKVMPWLDHGIHAVPFPVLQPCLAERQRHGLPDQLHGCSAWLGIDLVRRTAVNELVIPAEAKRKAGTQYPPVSPSSHNLRPLGVLVPGLAADAANRDDKLGKDFLNFNWTPLVPYEAAPIFNLILRDWPEIS